MITIAFLTTQNSQALQLNGSNLSSHHFSNYSLTISRDLSSTAIQIKVQFMIVIFLINSRLMHISEVIINPFKIRIYARPVKVMFV